MIKLKGLVRKKTYFNQENFYTIAKIYIEKEKNVITIVGELPGIKAGDSLILRGLWESHPKYGSQFRVESFAIALPDTVVSIREYLKSGVIKGVGPVTASKLVDHFGIDTLRVIEETPERLKEITGLGKSRLSVIKKGWKEHHAARYLLSFLNENGIKPSLSGKIFSQFGSDSVAVLKENPYILAAEMPANGFFLADKIARNIGMDDDDPVRIKAAIMHVLYKWASDGSVFIELNNLINLCEREFGIYENQIRENLLLLEQDHEIVLIESGGVEAVFIKHLYDAEIKVSERIKVLLSLPVMLREIDEAEIKAEVLSRLAIKLSEDQLDIVREVIKCKVSVITGGPGTGKTTLLRSLASIFRYAGKKVMLSAPTGRAARRLTEVTGMKAQTIHKMLGYNFADNYFDKNRDDPLDTYAIIVDEASMVDIELMSHLMDAITIDSVLIFVGDVFQLPSVGPGNVLSDIIRSEIVNVFYLTEIFRQESESDIVYNAHRIKDGESIETHKNNGELSDFYFIEQGNHEQIVRTIASLCKNNIPKRFGLDPVEDIQVITPMHKGITGTINLNHMLQKELNNENSLTVGGLKEADKVMHLKNNYQKDVYNGDIGIVKEIVPSEKKVVVNYYGRLVEYDSDDLSELSLAYTISVHKSQGSEYPAVIIPLTTQHFPLLQRNLLYTAITRGKELVVIVGTKNAIDIAISNDKPGKRVTGLVEKLKNP
ncbi:MAG: ATP-dependent RecD-like DNA helicase [Desulfobacterales bacterium]|nr:ATP-dependent RecD-like DNA helicase [Desulfobacterales bacterium]